MSAIFMVFVLAIVAAGVQTTARNQIQRTMEARWLMRADWAAEAGIEAAVARLREGVPPSALGTVEGRLHEAMYTAVISATDTAALAAAVAPRSATRNVHLIVSTGEALRDEKVRRVSRLSLLVRVDRGDDATRVTPIAWMPAHALPTDKGK